MPRSTFTYVYYVGDRERAELTAMLRDGRFRVHVPEEGALLVAAWLVEPGEAARAAALTEAIRPFFDRLRFYPVPHPIPSRSGTGVYLQTVGESTASFRARRRQPSVERMNGVIRVWAPLYDRAAALFLETVEGDPPSLRTDDSGAPVRRSDGNPIVDGGWPCKRFARDWAARARALLDEYQAARAEHRLCGKPERRKENFARLRGYMGTCVENPAALRGRDVGAIRKILASYVTRHDAPGSERLLKKRTEQARSTDRPSRHAIAGVLARRLETYPQDEGAPDVDSKVGPLSAEEASRLSTSAGEPVPRSLVIKGTRCLEAPIESLMERGLAASSESVARVLPMPTARLRASAVGARELRRAYEAVYAAFRRRRSLLLLDWRARSRSTSCHTSGSSP